MMEEKPLQEQEGSTAEKQTAPDAQLWKRRWIFIRYLLPPVTGLVCLVMSLFYTVRAAQSGVALWVSHSRLCFNSLKSARAYLISGEVEAGQRNFYILLAVGAGVAILCFLIAAILSGYALYHAIGSFREGESEQGKRHRILFKIILPNRACYFLVSCLYLVPALFPEYFSAVCSRFLQITGGSTALFIEYNLLLLVLAGLLVVTLALSFYIRKSEDALSMNVFMIQRKVEKE